jgi:hypothetical protein
MSRLELGRNLVDDSQLQAIADQQAQAAEVARVAEAKTRKPAKRVEGVASTTTKRPKSGGEVIPPPDPCMLLILLYRLPIIDGRCA